MRGIATIRIVVVEYYTQTCPGVLVFLSTFLLIIIFSDRNCCRIFLEADLTRLFGFSTPFYPFSFFFDPPEMGGLPLDKAINPIYDFLQLVRAGIFRRSVVKRSHIA